MARKALVCGRDYTAGPGTCWHWWDGCPAKVKECSIRTPEEEARAEAERNKRKETTK